jgi:hypothetical protein
MMCESECVNCQKEKNKGVSVYYLEARGSVCAV